jgi:hypothetical protein
MTYKKIVEGMVESSARKWVEELLEKSGFDAFLFGANVEVKKDPDAPFWMLWTVELDVHDRNSIMTYHISVGGTVDESGVCNSVIWNSKGHNIWFNNADTREAFGINEFKVA